MFTVEISFQILRLFPEKKIPLTDSNDINRSPHSTTVLNQQSTFSPFSIKCLLSLTLNKIPYNFSPDLEGLF